MMIKARIRSYLPLLLLPLLLAGPAQAKAQTAVPKAKTAAPKAKTAAPSAAARAELAKPFYVVEQRKGFGQLQAAVDAIGGGRGTIRIASGRYHQCAVQSAGDIAYVAAEAGGAIFEETVCEDIASLILRGSSARLDGLLFQNIRSPECAEAAVQQASPHSAIRLESGNLSILNSLFRFSDAAIIAADLPLAAITIRQASFSNLGHCREDQSCTAGLQLGQLARLRLFSNHFEGSTVSARTAIIEGDDNRFEDGPSAPPQQAMLALQSGAIGRLRGNGFILHHAPRSADQPAIAVAQQDKLNPSRGLVIDGNQVKFAEGVSGTALFVANYSGEAVFVGENDLSAGITAYQRPITPTAQ